MKGKAPSPSTTPPCPKAVSYTHLIETVRAGAQKCRENGVDVVLAVGGGSTIDASKAIAYAANYAGDAWDFIVNPSLIEADKVLPIVTVLTLSLIHI